MTLIKKRCPYFTFCPKTEIEEGDWLATIRKRRVLGAGIHSPHPKNCLDCGRVGVSGIGWGEIANIVKKVKF